jgi:hypothetical protein
VYLDDCAYHKLLANMLRQAGHSVVFPAQAGIAKEKDSIHLDYARKNGFILLTKNPKDFFELRQDDSDHAGIFAIYQDNDPTRDMTHADVVRAIANLEKAGVDIAGQFHILNHWRF